MIRVRGQGELVRAIRDGVPAAAGVYAFLNRYQQALYIGKSVNLRRRMLSYFRHDYDEVEPRLGRMIQSIEGFEFEATPGELAALLREDELIKRLKPEYNKRQNKYQLYRYLKLTEDGYPRLEVIDYSGCAAGREVFGPYQDKYMAADLVDIASRYLRLRTCSEPEPAAKCLNYSLERCLGPCQRTVDTRRYERIVRQVRDFLDGDETVVAERVRGRMDDAAENRQFEQAAGHRARLDFIRRVCARQRFINRFRTNRVILRESAGEREFVFLNGVLAEYPGGWAGNKFDPKYGPGDLTAADDRFVYDRANILYNWIKHNQCDYRFTDINDSAEAGSSSG